MSAGTLTLTNNSAAVSGAGTAFNTELAAGDFIVVTVGGVPYTLPVKSVDSATALTLVSVYTGPSQSGAAWSAVPRVALNMVTAALVAQSAEALRGLNYDKQNWQQVFSGTGTITVKLPDGSTYTGPAWNGIGAALDKKADKSSLGTAAGKDVGTDFDMVLTVGNAFGLGAELGSYSYSRPTGFYGSPPDTPTSGFGGGLIRLHQNSFDVELFSPLAGQPRFFVRNINTSTGGSSWAEFYSTANTTKGSDGTLKSASPIIKVFHNGTYETNGESDGCVVTRRSVGEYMIEGCMGMNADAAWGGIDGGFDIPLDRNKQPRIWLDYEVNSDGSILLKTFHRTHSGVPEFAQNIIDGVSNGEPVDIPPDSFVSVRVEMPQDSNWNKRLASAMQEVLMLKLEGEK